MKLFHSSELHKKWVVLFIVVTAFSINGYAQRSTGLFFDDESYSKVKTMSPAQSFTGTEDTAVSLRSFCPKAGDQGKIFSCVGWAIAYGAYTTAVSKVYNTTDKSAITNQAYSALFIYNQIKTSDCNGLASLSTAFDFMKNNGVCKAVEFNPSDCFEKPDEKIISLAKKNRIKSYMALFPLGAHSDLKVAATIKELYHGRPVVVGMNITKSFYELGKDGLWRPQPDEVYTGGHAMCVVGYDNLVKQFEILNSWGPDFGDKGYLYMSYKDFAKYCKYAYTFVLDDSQPNDAFIFKGSYYLNKLVG
jgi:hypothetical protein